MSELNTEPPAKGEGNVEKITKAVEGLLDKHGDPNAALRVLLNENHGYRDQLRDLKAKLPADGSVVLSGDDAADWGKFRSLGKFSDVNKLINDGKAASTRLSDIERTDELKALGKLADMTPAVFARLAKQDGLQFEKKPGKDKDGKAVEQVFVKGEADSLTPIDEYATAQWADFLPALKGEATPPPRPRGTPPPFGPNQPPPRPGAGEHDEVAAQLAEGRWSL